MPKSDFTASGIGCIHYGQIYTHYGTWATETISFVSETTARALAKVDTGDLVITNTSENLQDVCKAVAWLGNDQIVTGGHATVLKHAQHPKFLSYYFQTPQFSLEKKKHSFGAKVIDVSSTNLAKIPVPVPPLEVQQAIVNVLDSFSALQAELEAELEARRRQYEYYRDALLAFDGFPSETGRAGGRAQEVSHVRWMTLGEIATNLDSHRRPVTKSARAPGTVPYYGASGIVDYVSDYLFDGDYLLVSEDGANLLARVSPIAFSASGKIWVNNHAHVLQFKSYTERWFAEIYLNSIDLSPFVSGAAQPKLNQANLNRIPFPALPIIEQAKIVAILDQFDALVNDLSIGLPAELKSRRRQYEYYRDRLLTFPEAA